jgi:DNA-binding NarL/FixJ family response regulator
MTISVVIAEDHPLFRQGTKKILDGQPDIEVVGEAEDGLSATEISARLKPDVAVLDIRMPGLSGVEVTRRIQAQALGTAILILSAYDDDHYVHALLEAGASGYLLKTVRAGDLVEAVRRVARGEMVLDPAIASKLPRLLTRPQPQEDVLTGKEMDVLRLVCRGLKNKEIAVELTMSVRTVEGHLEAIFNKLGFRSRTEVALYASSRGWFSDEEQTA